MKRLVKKSKRLQSKNYVKGFQVIIKPQAKQNKDLINHNLEEFGIYLQYVRKLGFEETPDYDFLRELFNKVLCRLGETDDGVYDWMLLNKGPEVK